MVDINKLINKCFNVYNIIGCKYLEKGWMVNCNMIFSFI